MAPVQQRIINTIDVMSRLRQKRLPNDIYRELDLLLKQLVKELNN